MDFKRATVNAGVRFHYLKTHFPEQRLGPAYLIPVGISRSRRLDYANMKDLTPRVGVAYDLFGDGKTAVQGDLGQVFEQRRSAAGKSDPESVLYRAPQLDDRACRSDTRTTTRRNATC